MATARINETRQNESADPQSLSGVFDRLLEKVDGDQASVEELLFAFGNRSYGPLLLIPSLLALGPTGAIPGMSIVTGSLIILIAVQMLFRHGSPWLPNRIEDFSIPRKRLEQAIDKTRPYTNWVEQWIKPRLTFLSNKPGSYLIPVLSIVLAMTMFPLAIVPFGVALPAFALTLLSIGLTLKDGYFVIAGYLFTAASIAFALQFI